MTIHRVLKPGQWTAYRCKPLSDDDILIGTDKVHFLLRAAAS
jgi:hypothetical protein